jgi:hypothetical protein
VICTNTVIILCLEFWDRTETVLRYFTNLARQDYGEQVITTTGTFIGRQVDSSTVHTNDDTSLKAVSSSSIAVQVQMIGLQLRSSGKNY